MKTRNFLIALGLILFLLCFFSCKPKTELSARHVNALWDALEKNDASAVKELLEEQPALLNYRNPTGETPLYSAIYFQTSDQSIATYLIDKGADLNAADEKGWTPLHLAVFNNNAQQVGLLVKRGAKTDIKNKDNQTPAELADQMGNKMGAIIRLLERGMKRTNPT